MSEAKHEASNVNAVSKYRATAGGSLSMALLQKGVSKGNTVSSSGDDTFKGNAVKSPSADDADGQPSFFRQSMRKLRTTLGVLKKANVASGLSSQNEQQSSLPRSFAQQGEIATTNASPEQQPSTQRTAARKVEITQLVARRLSFSNDTTNAKFLPKRDGVSQPPRLQGRIYVAGTPFPVYAKYGNNAMLINRQTKQVAVINPDTGVATLEWNGDYIVEFCDTVLFPNTNLLENQTNLHLLKNEDMDTDFAEPQSWMQILEMYSEDARNISPDLSKFGVADVNIEKIYAESGQPQRVNSFFIPSAKIKEMMTKQGISRKNAKMKSLKNLWLERNMVRFIKSQKNATIPTDDTRCNDFENLLGQIVVFSSIQSLEKFNILDNTNLGSQGLSGSDFEDHEEEMMKYKKSQKKPKVSSVLENVNFATKELSSDGPNSPISPEFEFVSFVMHESLGKVCPCWLQITRNTLTLFEDSKLKQINRTFSLRRGEFFGMPDTALTPPNSGFYFIQEFQKVHFLTQSVDLALEWVSNINSYSLSKDTFLLPRRQLLSFDYSNGPKDMRKYDYRKDFCDLYASFNVLELCDDSLVDSTDDFLFEFPEILVALNLAKVEGKQEKPKKSISRRASAAVFSFAQNSSVTTPAAQQKNDDRFVLNDVAVAAPDFLSFKDGQQLSPKSGLKSDRRKSVISSYENLVENLDSNVLNDEEIESIPGLLHVGLRTPNTKSELVTGIDAGYLDANLDNDISMSNFSLNIKGEVAGSNQSLEFDSKDKNEGELDPNNESAAYSEWDSDDDISKQYTSKGTRNDFFKSKCAMILDIRSSSFQASEEGGASNGPAASSVGVGGASAEAMPANSTANTGGGLPACATSSATVSSGKAARGRESQRDFRNQERNREFLQSLNNSKKKLAEATPVLGFGCMTSIVKPPEQRSTSTRVSLASNSTAAAPSGALAGNGNQIMLSPVSASASPTATTTSTSITSPVGEATTPVLAAATAVGAQQASAEIEASIAPGAVTPAAASFATASGTAESGKIKNMGPLSADSEESYTLSELANRLSEPSFEGLLSMDYFLLGYRHYMPLQEMLQIVHEQLVSGSSLAAQSESKNQCAESLAKDLNINLLRRRLRMMYFLKRWIQYYFCDFFAAPSGLHSLARMIAEISMLPVNNIEDVVIATEIAAQNASISKLLGRYFLFQLRSYVRRQQAALSDEDPLMNRKAAKSSELPKIARSMSKAPCRMSSLPVLQSSDIEEEALNPKSRSLRSSCASICLSDEHLSSKTQVKFRSVSLRPDDNSQNQGIAAVNFESARDNIQHGSISSGSTGEAARRSSTKRASIAGISFANEIPEKSRSYSQSNSSSSSSTGRGMPPYKNADPLGDDFLNMRTDFLEFDTQEFAVELTRQEYLRFLAVTPYQLVLYIWGGASKAAAPSSETRKKPTSSNNKEQNNDGAEKSGNTCNNNNNNNNNNNTSNFTDDESAFSASAKAATPLLVNVRPLTLTPIQLEIAPLNDLINFFNRISFWVGTEICSRSELSQRVRVMEKMIAVAKKCAVMRNFNVAMAIFAGLSNSSVMRLKKTIAGLGLQARRRFERLDFLFRADNNYRNYRQKIESSPYDDFSDGLIPFFGLFLRDLTFMNENKKYIRPGVLNFGKVRQTVDTIYKLHAWQLAGYQIISNTSADAPKEAVSRYCANLVALNDQVLYKCSKVCETRNGEAASGILDKLLRKKN